MSHEVESLVLSKEPAWHGLGTIKDHALSSLEAILDGGLDWQVEKRPIYFPSDTQGQLKIFPNQYATVRSTDLQPLGVVSDRYQIVQNRDAFKWIEGLLGEGITFEAAGSLKGGRLVFILAHMPAQLVLGDEIRPYFMFSNWHDGTGTMDEILTPVRVVCWNTWNMALKGATRKFSVRHTGDMEDKQANVAATLQIASTYMDKFAMTAETLEQTKVSRKDFFDIVTEVWPEPSKTDESYARKEKQREKVVSMFLQAVKAPDLQKFSGTAYLIQQAASAFDTHAEPLRRTMQYEENHFISLMDGKGIQESFAKAIEKVCGVTVAA